MATDSDAEYEPSRWRGGAWFAVAALLVVIAGVMLFSEVAASDRENAGSCGVLLGSYDSGEAGLGSCDRRLSDHGSRILALLAVAVFPVVAGIRSRVERALDDRGVVGFVLLAVAAAMLLWPQTTDDGDTGCGAPLLRTSEEIMDSDESYDENADVLDLAECAVDRSKRVAWSMIWATAGTLVLTLRRRPTDDDSWR